MKKNIFKRPFQCSLQTTIMSNVNTDNKCNLLSNNYTKPSIEQVVKENIQLLQKPEDLPEEKILYEANGQEDDSSCQDEPPPPIPCQNLIKKLRKDKKTTKEVSDDTSNLINDNKFNLLSNEQSVRASNLLSDDDLTKMIRLVKRMKKLKV